MILTGTTYKIINEVEFFSLYQLDTLIFKISYWANPLSDLIRIELEREKQVNQLFIKKQHIEQYCELATNFGEAIYFYTTQDTFGEFSNFSPHGIQVNEKYYPTVEHYYQAQKFKNEAYSERIRICETPKIAATLGRSRDEALQANWEKLKLEVMEKAVQLKFTQHRELGELLLFTEEKLLIENSPYDNFWGIGRTGKGLNYLGTMLMRVRENLKILKAST